MENKNIPSILTGNEDDRRLVQLTCDANPGLWVRPCDIVGLNTNSGIYFVILWLENGSSVYASEDDFKRLFPDLD